MTDAEAALTRLTDAILADTGFRDRDWTHILLIYTIDGTVSEFDYLFGPGDACEAAGTDDWAILDHVTALRTATMAAGAPAWRQCLIHLARSTGHGSVRFDETLTRWRPDPADPIGHARRMLAGVS